MSRIPPKGSASSPIWFIGDVLSPKDLELRTPFGGPIGDKLRQFIFSAGIDPEECYFDVLIPVPSRGTSALSYFSKDGVPDSELIAHTASLAAKIAEHRPNLVVTLGAVATHMLTGHTQWDPKEKKLVGLAKVRGSIYECQLVPGQKVIPTFHPSYIFREGYADHGIFLADMERIKRESQFREIRRPEKKFIIDPSPNEMAEVKDRILDEGKIITLDIEYIKNKLLCVGFSNSADWAACVVPRSAYELDYLKSLLCSGLPLNAQNAMFDCSILEWHYGMEIFPFLEYDTMIAAHALNIELPKDLGFLCSIYTDQPYHKDDVNWDHIKKGKQTLQDLYVYNCKDVWTQHHIMERQLNEDFPLYPNRYEIFRFEMALLGPLWEMSKRGMLVDKDKMAELREEVTARDVLDFHVLAALNGGKFVNVKSGDDVADCLFTYLKLRPAGKTKKGKFKTDDKTLAKLLARVQNVQQRMAITLIRSLRQSRDVLSRFIDAPLDDDGRTRGMYNPFGTTTGRLASQKFTPTGRGHQQQNISRKVRSVIIADKGFRFGSVDKERAESLVVAHLTNDDIMLKHHEPGADAHRLLAQLYRSLKEGREVGPDEITKDQRYIFKQTRHAGNYMEGHITFMENMNKISHITGVSVTTKEAEEFIKWYREVHLGLRPWWLSIQETLHRTHELTTLLGRERTFFDRVDSTLPVAIAFVPQGTVGDLLNVALLNTQGIISSIAKRILPWHEEIPEIGAELRSYDFQLLNQVHDSIGFQFRPQHETRVQELLTKCLAIPLKNPHTGETFYIGDEFKFGNSWK